MAAVSNIGNHCLDYKDYKLSISMIVNVIEANDTVEDTTFSDKLEALTVIVLLTPNIVIGTRKLSIP